MNKGCIIVKPKHAGQQQATGEGSINKNTTLSVEPHHNENLNNNCVE